MFQYFSSICLLLSSSEILLFKNYYTSKVGFAPVYSFSETPLVITKQTQKSRGSFIFTLLYGSSLAGT